MMTDNLTAALELWEKNLSIIPINPVAEGPDKKKPLVLWTEYQNRQATQEELEKWRTRWPDAMIGIVTGPISNLFVIDCDTPEAIATIQEHLGDYICPVAHTPRGGMHFYFTFPDGLAVTSRNGIFPGCDIKGKGGYVVAAPSVNAAGKSYRWGTGLSIFEEAPGPLPDALYKYINSFSINSKNFCKDGEPQKATNNHKDHKFFVDGTRDQDLFTVANALVKGKCDDALIEQTLVILANNCTPPVPPKVAYQKIESARKRSDRKSRNIAAEVREWVETTTGHFLTTEMQQETTMTTREEKKAANMALNRLCEGPDAILEKHGNRRGCYRKIDRTIEFMDFANADPENHINLSLPLNIHRKTRLYPKSVICVAGVSGMGKTLFALNVIAANMDAFPVYYFNAEMGPEALKHKITFFPGSMQTWADKMKVVDGWDFHNIADKIQPDGLNVVDYLEPQGDKAYDIHGVISAIIRRLNKGLALILIQKKPGATLGTGGVYSIKAASLALALDWGKIEVVKNRFREADQFPNLNKINFDVKSGHEFVATSEWFK